MKEIVGLNLIIMLSYSAVFAGWAVMASRAEVLIFHWICVLIHAAILVVISLVSFFHPKMRVKAPFVLLSFFMVLVLGHGVCLLAATTFNGRS